MSAAPGLISQQSGNRKFHLSARTHFTPEIKVSADSLGPFAHARYAEVSRLSAGPQDFGVDALAIIAHPQTKLIVIVPDLHFDVARSGMCERISEHFARDAVDLVLEHWR